MEDFEGAKATYNIGDHPIKRYRKRVLGKYVAASYTEVQKLIQAEIDRGYVYLDYGRHRYIRSGNLFIPCIRYGADNYIVKSILLWNTMVARERDVIFRDIIQK